MGEWGAGLAILLGIIEGLTEFLPVSSTGHLIIVGHLLGFTGALAASVEISIQLGSILAVIVYERQKLRTILVQAAREQTHLWTQVRTRQAVPGRQEPDRWRALARQSFASHRSLWFVIGLGVAFLPAACVGLLTHDWIEAHLFHPYTVAGALIVGGVIILLVEAAKTPLLVSQLDQVGLRTAFLVGLAQCAALIPGVSRSGATIIGGLLCGLDRKSATEYSFFLALPTMIAATTYKLLSSRAVLTQEDYLVLGLGLLVSFLVGWAVIAAFLAFVKRHSFRAFAYYRILLGAAVLALFG